MDFVPAMILTTFRHVSPSCRKDDQDPFMAPMVHIKKNVVMELGHHLNKMNES